MHVCRKAADNHDHATRRHQLCASTSADYINSGKSAAPFGVEARGPLTELARSQRPISHPSQRAGPNRPRAHRAFGEDDQPISRCFGTFIHTLSSLLSTFALLCFAAFFAPQVWDLKRNNSRVTMRGHRGTVTCVSFFDRDSCVAAGDERGKVVLHRVADAPSNDEVGCCLLCLFRSARGVGVCSLPDLLRRPRRFVVRVSTHLIYLLLLRALVFLAQAAVSRDAWASAWHVHKGLERSFFATDLLCDLLVSSG